MFDQFRTLYEATAPGTGLPRPAWPGGPVAGWEELMSSDAGSTFNGGLYRLHDATTGPAADAWVADAFPRHGGQNFCFGYDWLGRQFALDGSRRAGGEPLVMLFEPGSGDAFEIPLTFADFHDEELIVAADEALSADLFAGWAAANPPLAPTECAGYRVPLFLGGAHDLANLEVIDLDVYWTISGQLLRGVRRLAPGTTIRQVSITDPE